MSVHHPLRFNALGHVLGPLLGTRVYLLAVTDYAGDMEGAEFEIHESEEACFYSLLHGFAKFGEADGAPSLDNLPEDWDPTWVRRYSAAVQAEDWKRAFLLWATSFEADNTEGPWEGAEDFDYTIHSHSIGNRGDATLLADNDTYRLPLVG